MGTWVDNPDDFGVNNLSWDLVNGRFDQTQAFAVEMKSLTVEYIDNLSSKLGGLSVPSTDELDVAIPNVPGLDYSGRPTFGNLSLPTGWPTSVPTKPSLVEYSEITPVSIPVMKFTVPEFSFPKKPYDYEITEPGDAPGLTTVNLPSAPQITLPTAPTLADVVVPSAPDVSVPAFNASYIDEQITVPGGFSWQESPYNSDVWQNLLNEVQEGLINGGTGLDQQVEEALWQRAKDRQRTENDKAYSDAENYFAARGHQLPPGALAGRMIEIGNAILLANQNLNTDIAHKQAELAKEHQQFITTTAVEVEKMLRGFHDAMVGRSLEAAKALVASGLDIYNASIEKQRLRMEKYKTDAQVYEIQIKGALAKVEVFRAKVDGVKATAEVNKSLVDVYNAQVGAIELSAKLYTAQLEGARIAEEIESLKLERYKLSVSVYAERVKAKALAYESYNTEMEGEKIKAQTYAEQVKAFQAEVDAKSTESDILLANLESEYKQNAITIEGYKADLLGYSSTIDAMSKKTSAVVDGFKAEVAGYSAETEMTSTMYSAKVKEIDANIARASLILQKSIAEIDASIKGYLGISTLQAKGLEGIANMGAQLCASALNAVNASATLGSSTSASVGQSYSHGEGITESHQYSHK